MKAVETWVFALLLLGGRSDAGKFIQVNETCSSSSKLFCLKENFVKFCIDLENFTVDWKIDFSCLMQSTEDDQCVSTPPTCEAAETTPLYTESTRETTAEIIPETTTETTTEKATEITPEPTNTTGTQEEISTVTEELSTLSTQPEESTPSTITTTPTSSTTPTTFPTGPPGCFGDTISPGTSCDTYYQCISVWWWWEPRLSTCPSDQLFSISQNKCVPAAESDCVD